MKFFKKSFWVYLLMLIISCDKLKNSDSDSVVRNKIMNYVSHCNASTDKLSNDCLSARQEILKLNPSLGLLKDITNLCEEKNVSACAYASLFYLNKKMYDETIRVGKAGCLLKEGASCTNTGAALKNLKRQKDSLSYFEKACSYNNGLGCFYLGLIFGERGNSGKEYISYEKGCGLGDGNSCFNLACINSLKKNEDKALKYLYMSWDRGFRDKEIIKNDKELGFLRSTPEFKKFILDKGI